MDIHSSHDISNFIRGFAYGMLLEEKLINSYPISYKNGIDIYKGRFNKISCYDNKKKITLTLAELKNKYKDSIKKEYLYLKKEILLNKKFYIEKSLKILENIHKKGTKTKTFYEEKFKNSYYFHKNKMYKILSIKENVDFFTYVVELDSGKKHTIQMNKKTFLKRDYFKKLYKE